MENSLSQFVLEFELPITPELIAIFEDDESNISLPIKSTKREYKKDLGNDELISLKPQDFILPYPNFTVYQPDIQRYAFANPENMASVLIFVLATQETTWADIMSFFPPLMQHIRQNDGMMDRHTGGYEKRDWTFLAKNGRGLRMEYIWRNRGVFYDAITRSYERDQQAGNTGFLVWQKLLLVPGLGIPKAGFATQLIIGKTGCIDSINRTVAGAPTELMNTAGNAFNPPKRLFRDATSEDPVAQLGRELKTKGSEKKLQQYITYLEQLKRDGSSSSVQQLWDDWCAITEYKSFYSGRPGYLSVDTGMGPAKIKPYHIDPKKPGKQSTSMRNFLQGLNKEQPQGDGRPKFTGLTVGQQHRDVLLNPEG